MSSAETSKVTRTTTANYDESSTNEQLLSRLEKVRAQIEAADDDSIQIWEQFASVWYDVLRHPIENVSSSYEESADILSKLVQVVDFERITKDKMVSYQTTFKCLELLNLPHIKSYFQLSRDEQESLPTRSPFIHNFMLVTMASQSTFSAMITSIADAKKIEHYDTLFVILINHVDRAMPDNAGLAVDDEYSLGELNEAILMLLWNAVDQTVLVPIFLKCGLAKKAVNWLGQASQLREASREPLISIVHNLSRHDDAAAELNQYGTIEKIKEYQKKKLEKDDSRTIVASMALALLSTPEQLKSDKKGMNNVLNQLLQLVMDAAVSEGFRENGFHVSEPLGVLVKMFVVEERTLDYVLCHAETDPPSDTHSTIYLFASLLFNFSEALKGTNRLEQFTLVALLNIFWSISFQSIYRLELVNDTKLIETLQTFIDDRYEQQFLEQYKPRSMEGIREAAHGTIHNLNLDNQDEPAVDKQSHSIEALAADPISPKNTKPMIMISYCHSNNTACDQLLSFLTTSHDVFDIWIDRTHCQSAGDLWEAIADGMEQSSVIVSIVSSQYFESKSCRKEFTYASDTLKKTVVPVLIENFQPRGWLGIRIPDMKYVRFRESQFEKSKLSELLNTILASFSTSTSPENIKKPQESFLQRLATSSSDNNIKDSQALRPLDQWSSKDHDITAWFTQNRVTRKIQDLFEFQTGQEMLDYGELLIKDSTQQMNVYSKVYSEKYNGSEMPPHEFQRFATALEQLLKENRPASYSAIKNSSSSNKSSACNIL